MSRVRQAVILAGGKGTRLEERLNGLPKPLIDVCGVPLLERQILLLNQHGFQEVLVLVNYAADRIARFCDERRNWGLDVKCIDDGEPRGTAGATLAVFDRLADEFLVMYGDTMMNVDLNRFHEFHGRYPEAAATLFVHPNDHPWDSDLVEIDDDAQILAFHGYPHDDAEYHANLVNAALYWVRKAAFEPWQHTEGMLDFAKDLFPEMLQRGLRLQAYNSPEYVKDIGTPTRLDRVCDDFLSGKISGASLHTPQAAVFLDRDGTISREVNHLRSHEEFELLPHVPEAIRRLNRSAFRCCVVTNQPVVARGDCSFEDLRETHNKMETLLGQAGAFLDRIYVCPHHPDKGFEGERPDLKIDCECRKPKTGMIDRASIELNIDRSRSWMVGDQSVDVETARRAGLKSVLLETGYGGLDYRYWAQPDFILEDLRAAVDFILEIFPGLAELGAELVADVGDGAIILIGGQSRCGKSTFASIVREALSAIGKRAHVLAADRWLKNNAERSEGVLGRYDLESLQRLVHALESDRPAELRLPGYQKLERARYEQVETIKLSNEDVVVIEGTVALALTTGDKERTHRIHVEVPEGLRKQRFLREYRLRGADESAAIKLYESRLEDEFPVVERFAEGARQVFLRSQ